MIFINLLLIAVNAKYIHSSLAVMSLAANCSIKDIKILEFTINQNEDYMLAQIFAAKPDCVGFSCYIWNISIIKRLINSIKKIMPETIIILGGPEVTYNPVYFPDSDIIIRGESEEVLSETLNLVETRKLDLLCGIKGISFIKNGEIYHNEDSIPPDLNNLKFAYQDLDVLKNRIVYYESSRGCPYFCAYCLQSAYIQSQRGVRFLNLDRVFNELSIFFKNKTPQVKFVDRTFNCNKERAKKIWNFLIDEDNGVTNFHFEIGADLLDDDMLALLKRARKGLFQFEAGVQSTNQRTLTAVNRSMNTKKLLDNAEKIKSFNNIHMHLDLIAGLPYEDYETFKNSFNEVYKVKPDMLQLGFLKLLHGSALRENADFYGIKFKEDAPYEILLTSQLKSGEIFQLKDIEKMVDIFYNTGRYKASIKYFMGFFKTPFDFYCALAEFWKCKGYFDISHNRLKMYDNLYEFSQEKCLNKDISAELLRYDILESGNTSELPSWCAQSIDKEIKRKFYHNEIKLGKYIENINEYQLSYIIKNTYLSFFTYNIISWLAECDTPAFESYESIPFNSKPAKKDSYIFFNYLNKNINPKAVDI